MNNEAQIAKLATEAKAEQLAEVKAHQAKGDWLAAYYAGSAVASVAKHYKRAAYRTLKA